MKKSKLMTKDERAFQVAAVIVLGVLSLCAILPFVLIFIASFTEEKTPDPVRLYLLPPEAQPGRL